MRKPSIIFEIFEKKIYYIICLIKILEGFLLPNTASWKRALSRFAGLAKLARISLFMIYNFTRFSLSELVITDTELKLIAAAAIIGDNSIPKKGYNTPAAIGIPAML